METNVTQFVTTETEIGAALLGSGFPLIAVEPGRDRVQFIFRDEAGGRRAEDISSGYWSKKLRLEPSGFASDLRRLGALVREARARGARS